MFYDPLTTLGFLAAKTKKIHLGTSVLVLPYRNPVVLAKMISTLDVVSDGRVILGVGSGWIKAEFDALGVAYDKRGKLTDEYIEIMKELWTSDYPEYNREEFAFSNINFLPKPYQKPHPPVWVGGQSKNSIQRAALFGDGWHPVGLTPEHLKEKVAYLNELLPEEKRETFVISLRRNVEINEEREFSDDETLRGSPEKIMKGIGEYIDAGASHFVLYILSGDLKGVLQTMKTFSTTIMPAIR
jgi:probable F420-dependent oxidoreductase